VGVVGDHHESEVSAKAAVAWSSVRQHYEMPRWDVGDHEGRTLKMTLHHALQSVDPIRNGFGTDGASL
jgi:hypothetical protein